LDAGKKVSPAAKRPFLKDETYEGWHSDITEFAPPNEKKFTSGHPAQELHRGYVAHTTRNDSLAACER
jgi:hypothetical protein